MADVSTGDEDATVIVAREVAAVKDTTIPRDGEMSSSASSPRRDSPRGPSTHPDAILSRNNPPRFSDGLRSGTDTTDTTGRGIDDTAARSDGTTTTETESTRDVDSGNLSEKITLAESEGDESRRNVRGKAKDDGGWEEPIILGTADAVSIPEPGTRKDDSATRENRTGNVADRSSPISTTRLSRIDSARQDMRKLKSATIDRMGKMFKSRASQSPEEEVGRDGERRCGENSRRTGEASSLGRMLRLVGKDGTARKLFARRRSGSLSDLGRMRSTAGNFSSGNSDDTRNIFSRMIGQLKGRNGAEPGRRAGKTQADPPKPSISTRLFASWSTRSSSSSSAAPGENENATGLIASQQMSPVPEYPL